MANMNFTTQASQKDGVVTLDTPQENVQSVAIAVAGQRIVVRTDRSEAYLMSLAQEVNACVESIRRSAPSAGLPQIMALVAMQLAERARVAEQSDQMHCRAIEQHAQRLSDLLADFDDGSFQT